MNIKTDWIQIRQHFNRSFSSNFHISVGSVDVDGAPTVTPIGSFFLNDNQTGFYFEKFASKLPENSKLNPKICLLGVNSGRIFWLKSLFTGKFTRYPAIKLYGELGTRRKATEREKERLNRRMKITRGLKGNTYLWKEMEFIREVQFTNAEKINLGKMTQGLK